MKSDMGKIWIDEDMPQTQTYVGLILFWQYMMTEKTMAEIVNAEKDQSN